MIQNSNTCEAFEVLKKFIIENCNGKLASGGKEVRKRCHICGDSRDISDMHMYIGMKNGSIVYNCFKCGGSYVDAKFLHDIGCYDQGIINLVLAQNRSNKKSNSIGNGNFKTFISEPKFACNLNLAMPKLEYLTERLGTGFSAVRAEELGIVCNIGDFLTSNGIQQCTRSDKVMWCLHNFFVGFLSVDRSYIIERKIIDRDFIDVPECNSRYVNYNIFDRNEAKKLYIIPGEIDPLLPIRINLAEGPITILGVYLNTEASLIENSIFACCCGKAYGAAINYFLQTLGLINIDLHVYPDDDMEDSKLKYKIYSYLKIYGKATIHRNTLSGDFGVPKKQIKEYVYPMYL